jgi:hypothetical protein
MARFHVSSKASLYSDLKEKKMNRSLIKAGVVCAIAIALLILAPVLAQEESGTTAKQRKKEESEEKLIRVYAEDKEGNKKLELTATRDEALPIIFAAYESLSSPRLQSNVLKELIDYKGTKHEDRIMAFLRHKYFDGPSSKQRGDLLLAGLGVNSRHPVPKLMLNKAAEIEGKDELDKRFRELACDIMKYFDTGDEELLEKWRLSAELLKPPEDSNDSQKQGKGGE